MNGTDKSHWDQLPLRRLASTSAFISHRLVITAVLASPRNNLRSSWNFLGDASVWTVAPVYEGEQTAILF